MRRDASNSRVRSCRCSALERKEDVRPCNAVLAGTGQRRNGPPIRLCSVGEHAVRRNRAAAARTLTAQQKVDVAGGAGARAVCRAAVARLMGASFARSEAAPRAIRGRPSHWPRRLRSSRHLFGVSRQVAAGGRPSSGLFALQFVFEPQNLPVSRRRRCPFPAALLRDNAERVFRALLACPVVVVVPCSHGSKAPGHSLTPALERYAYKEKETLLSPRAGALQRQETAKLPPQRFRLRGEKRRIHFCAACVLPAQVSRQWRRPDFVTQAGRCGNGVGLECSRST